MISKMILLVLISILLQYLALGNIVLAITATVATFIGAFIGIGIIRILDL